jgi:hypothetical protein
VVFVAREVVVVVAREVVEPMAVAENFIAPGIEIDGSSEGIERVDVELAVDILIRKVVAGVIGPMLLFTMCNCERWCL